MNTDRLRLIRWIIMRTMDRTLHWDYQETPSGGQFACNNSIGKFGLVSNPSWFIVKDRDNGTVFLWLEGELCQDIYVAIWRTLPPFLRNIPTIELACIIEPLMLAYKSVQSTYAKTKDGVALSDEDRDAICVEYRDHATESYPTVLHVDDLPTIQAEVDALCKLKDCQSILAKYEDGGEYACVPLNVKDYADPKLTCLVSDTHS